MTASPTLVALDALLFFEAAMRHMSFAGAAEDLKVSSSAVSQRIKTLEQSLGVQLFERRPHGLGATEAARLYLLEIGPALERVRWATSRVASKRGRRRTERARRFSVDMLPALASARVAPLLRSFKTYFPDVELKLSSSPGLSSPTRDGFDCCVRYGPGRWEGVDSEILAEELVFPVCSKALLAGAGPLRNAADLLGFDLIHDLMPLGWGEWLGSLGVSTVPRSGPVFSDSAIALRAAAEGLGIALARQHLVAPELASGRLVRPVAMEQKSPFSYWLVRPVGRNDGMVDLFGEWLRREVFC